MVALPDFLLESRLLWIFSIAAHAVLAWKLYDTGLWRRYRMFFAYMVAAGTQFSLHFCLPWLSTAYMWTWVVTEAAISVLYVLVLHEADVLILEDYPAIRKAGRQWLFRILAASIVVSAMTLYPHLAGSGGQRAVLVYFQVLERGILFSLTLFVLFFLAFVVRYHLVLRRNIVMHTFLFASYFLSSTIAYFILNLTGRAVTDEVNLVLLGISGLSLVAWITGFDPAGEEAVPVRDRPRRADAVHVLNQLEALNAALLGPAKKSYQPENVK